MKLLPFHFLSQQNTMYELIAYIKLLTVKLSNKIMFFNDLVSNKLYSSIYLFYDAAVIEPTDC